MLRGTVYCHLGRKLGRLHTDVVLEKEHRVPFLDLITARRKVFSTFARA